MADKIKITLPVVPTLDKKASRNLTRDIKRLEADLGPIKVSFGDIAKATASNIQNLKKMTAETIKTSKEMSSAMKKVDKEIKKVRLGGGKGGGGGGGGGKKGGGQSSVGDATEAIDRMTSAIDSFINSIKKSGRIQNESAKEIQKTRRKQMSGLDKFVDKQTGNKFDTVDFMKNFKGVFSGGAAGFAKSVGGALSHVGKSVMSSMAKTAMNQKESGRTGGTAAVAGVAGIATSVGLLSEAWQLIKKVSDHMTNLNKTLLKGTGLANDYNLTGEQYKQTVKDITGAAVNASGGLLKFGTNSEKSLEMVNAFGREASGSIRQTAEELKNMGGGDLSTGLETFSKNALIYGKALGVEGTEVASMMGSLVSEVGMNAQGAVKAMDMVVKAASTSGMPVHKFMDVFRTVLPDLDMFTNRIEEVTGAMKVMAKSMDPKGLKNFMQTMGKGFDQMDFKQRLKMALIIGPQKVAGILEKDFKASGEALAKQVDGFGDEIKNALNSGDPVKAMASVAAKMASKGVSGTKIAQAQGLARHMGEVKKGNVLNTATAMRGAGLGARTKMLQEYAGKFTGGDIGGLGEHVAKQLGVSEQEYKAILALNDNTAMYAEQTRKFGKTSSKSLNENLRKVIKNGNKTNKEMTEDQVTEEIKKLSGTALQDALMEAGSMQIEQNQDTAKSMEDLTVAQVNATTSISDKIENIIGFWLEKVFVALSGILSDVDSILDIFISGDSKESRQRAEDKRKTAETTKKYINDMDVNNFAKGYSQRSGGTGEISGPMQSQISTIQRDLKSAALSADPKDLASSAKPLMSQISKMSSSDIHEAFGGLGSDFENMIKRAAPAGNEKGMEKLLNDYLSKPGTDSSEQQGRLFGSLNKMNAILGAKGIKVQTGAVESKKLLTTKEQANQERDDNIDLYSGDSSGGIFAAIGEAAKSAAMVPGQPGVSSASTSSPAKTEAKEHKEAANTTAESTEKVAQAAAKTAAVEEDTYQKSSDTLSLLKKGIRFEKSFLSNEFKNVLRDATLESFRTALFEFAVLTNMEKVKNWAGTFSEGKVSSASEAMRAVGDWANKGGGGNESQGGGPTGIKAYADGGPINYDQIAQVHKGEFVVPRGGALISGSGGGKSISIGSINVMVKTDADPKQIAQEVHNVFRHQ